MGARSSSEGSGAIKPAYLIGGTDVGKIDAALTRLRARAEREGGPGALESFATGDGPSDPDALIAAIPSMSLMAERR
jgi:DNA polymerase III delta subunit